MITAMSLTWFLLASPYTDLFQEASTAYDQGQYDLAIQRYEQLIREDVVAPAVFYNLGNAYYRDGHLGPAIANYERALQLNPGYRAARDNLASAVQEIRRNLERPQPSEWETSLLFWHYGLSLSTSLWLAVSIWCLFWVLLALRRWRPLPYARGVAAGAALLALAFSASAWSKTHPIPLAVASRSVVVVRYLPQEQEPARFELYEGDRVRVEDEKNAWILVETASGERGWAPTQEFTLVGPPYVPYVEEQTDHESPTEPDTSGV